jgi:hypothetical protein
MTINTKTSVLLIFLTVSVNAFAQYNSYDYSLGKYNALGKYNILQYRANVRIEPTRNSDVISILNLHDEIEILENSRIEEKINDVWSFWYKIKYGNIIGYTFGGNIAIQTFLTDIDKNGINDYFYCRISSNAYGVESWSHIRPNTDIIIYINNKRIRTNTLPNSNAEFFVFKEEAGYVFLNLHYSDSRIIDSYKISSNGRIEYIGTETHK